MILQIILLKCAKFDDEKSTLRVTWNDKAEHESDYKLEWLKARNFTDENRNKYLKTYYRQPKILWGKKDFPNALKHFNFNEIIQQDVALYEWLHSMIVNGVAIITNVPKTEREARAIADRVGFIRQTHYGNEFMVKAKEDTPNVAYLSSNLQMHTDLPYYDYAPGKIY